jgi:hypothetical protein
MLTEYETYCPNLFFFLSTELAEMYCGMSAKAGQFNQKRHPLLGYRTVNATSA